MADGAHRTGLQIVPLGGVGEFGLNCLLLMTEGKGILVDCGLSLADLAPLGIDFCIPDFSVIDRLRCRLTGIFLTHGHEDHTGALPYLLSRHRAPVYGTPLTLALAASRLRDVGVDATDLTRVARAGDRVSEGPFTVEFLAVTHSIPDAVALAITTPAGVVIHTGDFKIDPAPGTADRFDRERFAAYGEAGVLALCSDSTNAPRPGTTPSEATIGPRLAEVIATAPGRVIFTTFSSHFARIRYVAETAATLGRQVGFLGRRLQQTIKVGRQLGYFPSGPAPQRTKALALAAPLSRQCLIVSGCQGEPLSVLSRLLAGEYPGARLEPGDRVIISARIVPGNERAVARIINQILRQEGEVVLDRDHDLHVSGHASQEELRTMIALTRPAHLIPIHGDFRHLQAHAWLGEAAGLSPDRVHLIQNGDILEFRNGRARRAGAVPTGRVPVDVGTLKTLDAAVVEERRQIAGDGIVLVVISPFTTNGRVSREATVVGRGCVASQDLADVLAGAEAVLQSLLEENGDLPAAEPAALKTRIRKKLRKYFEKKVGKRPVIIPVLHPGDGEPGD